MGYSTSDLQTAPGYSALDFKAQAQPLAANLALPLSQHATAVDQQTDALITPLVRQSADLDSLRLHSTQHDPVADARSTRLDSGAADRQAKSSDPLTGTNSTDALVSSDAKLTRPKHNSHRRASNSNPSPTGSRTTSATKQWTIMVYMAGDSLETFGIKDFQELAAIGSNSNVNLVVEFDRTSGLDSSFGNWTDTRRGLIKQGDKPNLKWGNSIGEVNMGDDTSLSNFVNWSMSNYQANRYALVTWGHGSGLNVSYDDQTGDSISAKELNSVLSRSSKPVSLVGADACLMSTTEFAYEISNNASVFVGSQELEPGDGWNYSQIVSNLTTKPTMDEFQLGTTIVNSYASYYSLAGDGTETLSAINLAMLRKSSGSLTSTIDSFVTSLFSASSLDLSVLGNYRDLYANQLGFGYSPDSCDIGKLFSSFSQATGLTSAVRSAAQAVLSAYNSSVIANYSAAGNGTGLSLYFSARGIIPDGSYNGSNLRWANDTRWDDFLNWIGW